MGKNGSILKWIEYFKLNTKSIIGVRMCSLSYVFDDEARKATKRPDLIAHQPHLADYGSITEEFYALTSHDHPLYAQDNGNMYDRIERALRGMSHSSTIIRFRHTCNGKGAMDALVSQFDGKVIWEIIIKYEQDYLMNKQWSGTTHQTLKAHIDRHQSAFVSLSKAFNNVSHQLPKNCTRVRYLIDSITSTDVNVVAALASIRMYDTGRREYFEKVSIFLAQIFPITIKKGGGKPTEKVGAAGAKLSSGVGSTGVELHYYKNAEFMALTPEQRAEVSEYNATKDGGKWKGNGKGKGKPLDKKLSQNDGGLPSEKKIKSMISTSFAEQTNDTSRP